MFSNSHFKFCFKEPNLRKQVSVACETWGLVPHAYLEKNLVCEASSQLYHLAQQRNDHMQNP